MRVAETHWHQTVCDGVIVVNANDVDVARVRESRQCELNDVRRNWTVGLDGEMGEQASCAAWSAGSVPPGQAARVDSIGRCRNLRDRA